MASKKDFSEIGDVEELGILFRAFEEMNTCILSVSLELASKEEKPGLVMIVRATTKEAVGVEAAQLALSRFNLRQLNYGRVRDAVMYGLYQIDAQIAEQELYKSF